MVRVVCRVAQVHLATPSGVEDPESHQYAFIKYWVDGDAAAALAHFDKRFHMLSVAGTPRQIRLIVQHAHPQLLEYPAHMQHYVTLANQVWGNTGWSTALKYNRVVEHEPGSLPTVDADAKAPQPPVALVHRVRFVKF